MSFPRSFPSPFGDDGYMPADPGLPPLVYDDDHVGEGIDRLIQQFKTKPRIQALLAALLHQVQFVEIALWGLLTERRLINAVGVPLERLGLLVGQKREGLDDDGLRAFIRARILLNRSRGRASDIAAVLIAAVANPAYAFSMLEFPPAMFLVRLRGALPSYATPTLVASILREAKAESVRLDVEYDPATEADTLIWQLGPGQPAASQSWAYGTTGGKWAALL